MLTKPPPAVTDVNQSPTRAANPSSTAIANSVVPESKAAVWRIATGAGIAVGYALMEVFAVALPAMSDSVAASLPVGLAASFKIGAASVAAWLLATAKTKHSNSVVTALNTEPPKAMNKFYTTKE